jgi:hypothetical protein
VLIGFIAPEGELLSFARPRQLLLHCSTSCIHAVEKKVTKEKAARLPLVSLGTSLCLALRVQGMQIGYPADLSCAPRFRRGLPEGPSLALWQRAASMQRPYGLFSPKAAVLGAANGMKPPLRNIS